MISVLFCYVTLECADRTNLSVRSSSADNELGIKRSIAELRSFNDSTRYFYDDQITLLNLFFQWRIMLIPRLILIGHLLRKLAEKNLLGKDKGADRTAGAKF